MSDSQHKDQGTPEIGLRPLKSDAPVIVYIDFKSPYAYLAVEPTRELERELGVQFDWRPFVLDIPSYLGSARLGKNGEVLEQQRSEEQWSGVKYAYYDCRRYARLRGLRIRGTEKIWDTQLASAAMLWTKRISYVATQQFIDRVYPPFWVRELDLESESVVAGLLSDLGLDGAAFLDWAHSGGLESSADFQAAAFDAGVYGVPTYVVNGERYFGREHLPRVRWELEGRQGAAPDIANPLPATLEESPRKPERVFIGIDDSLDSLLALPKLVTLLGAYSGQVSWLRVSSRMPGTFAPDDEDLSRSAMHQRYRRQNTVANISRYEPDGASSDGSNSPSSYADRIADVIVAHNIEITDDGPDQLMRPAGPGIVMLLDDELFIGRQHLPLMELALKAH